MSAVEQRESGTVAVAGVSEYAARIGRALRQVGGGVVEGEVQKPKRVGGGGMLVFDLSDGEAVLSCKVFARDLRRLEHEPRHGDLVQVRIERPDFWAPTGRVSVIVTGVRLAGEGELLRRRAELLERLAAEGLSDPSRRKPLPSFPRAVGVIAGRASDGMSDVVRALVDRFPPVHVVRCAALVQGAAAPRDLVDALARMQDHPLVDVIVIARGGGSVQDLVAFDDERLCRALFACSKPVITAIGHTDNVPVCNHVAWAAYTPSRSAEMAVPSGVELRQGIALAARCVDAVPSAVARELERIAACASRLRAATRLEALVGDVKRRALDVTLAQRGALAERERCVAEARAAIAAVARRVPGADVVKLVGLRLDARAAAFFAERTSAVGAAGARLDGMPAASLAAREAAVGATAMRLNGVPAASLAAREAAVGATAERLDGVTAVLGAERARVAEQGRLVSMGTRRQLADHDRDYGRALARLGREAAAGLRRRLRDAARDARHVAALIAAQDMRPRGWVLAARADGARLRSAADAPPGTEFHLDFTDGRVEARARDVDFPGEIRAARRDDFASDPPEPLDFFDEEAA
ncbi:MAG TPA: exodeoxyribonuclease VII large subunit [Solirubrobacteraceae bacterium]|jgi:exodeoxyribonuclease VII large subunit